MLSDEYKNTIDGARYLGAVRVFVWLEGVIGNAESWMLRRRFAKETNTPFESLDAKFTAVGITARIIREKTNCTRERAEDIAGEVISAIGGRIE